MFYLLLILVLIRLAYYILIFSKLALFKPKYQLSNEGVSILICIKNNLEGLRKLLTKLLKQNYTNYEIILVDDFSSEPIDIIKQEFQSDKIKIIKPSKDILGKKQAVEDGVNHATFDWILQTDSDCMPASLDWIKWMMASRKNHTEIVLGFSPSRPLSPFIGSIAAYETFYIAIQYLSYALHKIPYMGVGRNILYSKKAFLKAQPYSDNKHIASGDDDYLVQKISNKENTEICIEPNATTYTNSPYGFRDYLLQKYRHTSTSYSYGKKHKILLGLFSMIHILFYFFFIISLIFQLVSIKKLAGLYLLMTGVMWIIKFPIAMKLKQTGSLLWFHISDLFLSVFYVWIALKMVTQKEIEWK